MKKTVRRLISMLLVLGILAGFMPGAPFAAEAKAAYEGVYDSTNFVFVLRRGQSSWHSDHSYTNLPESWQEGDYIQIYQYTGNSNAVEIPDTYVWTYKDGSSKELPITGIYSYYFNRSLEKWYTDRVDVEYLKVGKNITDIGNSLVSYCENLKEVEIAEGSKLTQIGSSAFTECTSLERVGVNGTDKLPAGLESIGSYAFHKCYKLKSIDMSDCTVLTQIFDLSFGDCTSLSSVKLPPNLEGMGSFDTFQGCTSLTSIDIPASVTYIAAYCFEGCRNLSSITFRGDLADNFASGYLSLRGISDNATIYVDFSKQSKTYDELIDKIYGHNGGQLGANGGVKLRAIGSSFGAAVPTVRSSSAVVTLSGTGAGEQHFAYDWNDTDGDGVGGIVVINGRESDLKLTINAGLVSGATSVYWGSNRAFSNRLGTDDYEILRGKELADTMSRGEALAPSSADGATVELTIDKYSSPGVYYYFPKLVSKGSAFRPLSAAVGAPVMVIYHMEDPAAEEWQVYSGANIVFNSSATDRSCALTNSAAASITNLGFETPWLADLSLPLENGVTEANAGGYSITYQWKRNSTESLVGAVDVPQAHGGSGYAVYAGYDRAGGRGCDWEIPGISQSYVDQLGEGIYYFIPVVTVTVGGRSYNLTMEPYKVTIYGDMKWDPSIYPAYNQNGTFNAGIFRFDETETDTYVTTDSNVRAEDDSNIKRITSDGYFRPSMTSNPYSDKQDPHKVQTGTRNLLITPSVILPAEGLMDIRYEWSSVNVTKTGSNNNAQVFSTAPVITPADIGMDRADVGDVFYVSCTIKAYSGTTEVKSLRGYFYIAYADDVAAYGTPSYNDSPVFLSEQSGIYIADESENYGTSSSIRAKVDEDTVFNSTVYQLYRVDQKEQNRGGELVLTSTAGSRDELGAYIYWNSANDLDTYQPFWAYWKVTNGGKNGAGEQLWHAPTYSEVFLFVPTRYQMKDGVAKPTGQSISIERPAVTDIWVPSGESRTLSFEVTAVNMPLIYDLPDYNSMVEWFTYDEGDREGDASSMVFLWGSGMSYGVSDIEIELNGTGYTMRGRVDLTISNVPGNADDFFAYHDNGKGKSKGDSGWTAADPYILQMHVTDNAYFSGTEAWSEQLRIYYAQDSVSHTVSEVAYDKDPNLVTGRMEWTYDRDENGDYGYAWREAEDLDSDSYLIFSDSYDGANDVFGMPDSPPAQFALRATGTGAVPQWIVTDPYTGESVVLEAGDAPVTFGPTFGDGSMLRQITVSVGATLETVDGAPNCLVVSVAADKDADHSDYRVLVTPRAVKKDGSGRIVSAEHGSTMSVTLNRLGCAQKATANTYGSAVVKSSAQKNGLPITYTAWISNLESQQVTYQWYRSLDSTCNIGSDTPIGSKLTATGGVRAELVIDRAEVKRLEELGAGKAYYYLYMEVYNENASEAKRATSYSGGEFELTVDPNIKVMEDQTYTYDVPASMEIYYDDEIPQSLCSVIVSKPEHRISQQVYLLLSVKDIHTGEVYKESYYAVAGADYDPDSDSYELEEDYHGTITDNEDGTFTYTADMDKRYFDDYRSDVEVTVQWAIDESAPWEDYEDYASGGMSNETLTNACVLTVKSADPATLSGLALDSATGTLVTVSAAFMEKIGASTTQLPAFSQVGTQYDYCRPIGIVPGFNDELFRVQLDLQYWDSAENKWKSTEFDQSWDDVGYTGPADFADAGLKSVVFYDRVASEEEAYPYAYRLNPMDDTVYLRIAAVTTSGDNGNSYDYDEDIVGDAVYSEVFAVRRICTVGEGGACYPAEATDAQEPSAAESLPNIYWSSNDSTTSSVTLGLPGNYSVTDGGTLTYQWRYNAIREGYYYGEWKDIPGATSDTLVVSKALFDELKETSLDWVERENDYITFELVVINTNPAVSGTTQASAWQTVRLYYGDYAVTPKVSLSGGGDIVAGKAENAPAGVLPKVTISNMDDMGISRADKDEESCIDYRWLIRVIGYTDKNGNTVVLTGEDLEDFTTIGNLNAEQDNSLWIPDMLSGSYSSSSLLIKGQWYYMRTDADYSNSLWNLFNSVTVELYCEVTNYDYAAEDNYAEALTNTVTLNLKAPDKITGISGNITFKGGVDKIVGDGSVTLLAPADALAEGLELSWYRYGNDRSYHVADDDGTGTLVITANGRDGSCRFDPSTPYYRLRVTDTESGIERFLEPVLVLRGYADRAAEPYRIGSTNDTKYTDPGEVGDAYFGGSFIAPDGGVLSYQWQKKVDGSWVDIPGAVTDDLPLAAYDDVPGRYDFRIAVTNTITLGGVPTTASTCYEYTLYVHGLWVSLPAVMPAAVPGKPYSVPITVEYIHEYEPTAYDWSASSIGGYRVTDNGDGTFSLTASSAAALTGGTLTLKATIDETIYTASCSVDITTRAVAITTAALEPVPVGEVTEIALTGLTESGPITWSLEAGAPAWLSINSATGVLTANKPAAPGYYEFTVKAQGSGSSDSRTYQLAVRAGIHESLYLISTDGTQIDVVEQLSGSGWSYDPNLGVLTLDNYSGYYLYGSDTAPLWIRLVGTSTFTGKPDDWNSLFNYDGPVTLTSDGPAVLNLTEDDPLLGNGGGNGLSLDDLTIHENVTVNVDIRNADDSTYGWSVGGVAALRGDGTLNISVKSTDTLTYRYYYGVSDDLYVYDGVDVNITVDGNHAVGSSVMGIWGGLHTRGTGMININVMNGTYFNLGFGWGGEQSTFRHTGGTVSVKSVFDQEKIGNYYGGLYPNSKAPIYEENLYLVTRSDVPGNYSGSWMRVGQDGPAVITPSGAFSYTLGINEEMRTLKLKAACDSAVVWEITEGALPDGVTLTTDGYNATVSGAPTKPGSFSATIKAKNAHGAYSSNSVTLSFVVSDTRIWVGLGDEVMSELYMTATADLIIQSHYLEYSGTKPHSWAAEVPESAPFALTCSNSGTVRLYAAFKEGKSEADLTIDTYYDVMIKALDEEDNVIATAPLRIWIRSNAVGSIRIGYEDLVDDPKAEDYGTVGDEIFYDHTTATLYLTDYVGDKPFTITGEGELTVVYDGSCVIDTDYTTETLYIGDWTHVVFRAADDAASLTLRHASPYGYQVVDAREEVTFIGGSVLIEAERTNGNDSVWWTDTSGDSYINLVDVQSFIIRNLASGNSAFYKECDPFGDFKVSLEFSKNYYTVGGKGNDVFAVGTVLPEPTVIVTGSGTVQTGKTAVLTAEAHSLLEDDSVKYYTVSGGTVTEDTAEKTFTWTYQWYRDGVALGGKTAVTLEAESGGVGGATNDYTVAATYTHSFFGGSAGAESEPFTLTTIDTAVNGTASESGISVEVENFTGTAYLAVARYDSYGRMLAVELIEVDGSGTYQCTELTYESGCVYRAFLMDRETYEALCGAAQF